MTVDIRDVPEQSRYEIHVDGERAGLAEYHRHDGVVALTHTEVDDRFGGQGLAGQLVAFALDDVRARGERVQPFCPYVRRYIGQHDEYLDLVAAEDRDRFALPPA